MVIMRSDYDIGEKNSESMVVSIRCTTDTVASINDITVDNRDSVPCCVTVTGLHEVTYFAAAVVWSCHPACGAGLGFVVIPRCR